MGHDIARGRKHRATYVAALRGSARHFYLRHVARKKTVDQGGQAQHGYDGDPNHNVAARPGWRFSIACAALGAVDSQALQIFVLCVNRHKIEYELSADLVPRKSPVNLAAQ